MMKLQVKSGANAIADSLSSAGLMLAAWTLLSLCGHDVVSAQLVDATLQPIRPVQATETVPPPTPIPDPSTAAPQPSDQVFPGPPVPPAGQPGVAPQPPGAEPTPPQFPPSDPLAGSGSGFDDSGFDDFDSALPGAGDSLGATRASFSSAPTFIGDFFGGGFSAFGGSQTVTRSFTAPGTILSGGDGDPLATIGFALGADQIPNDVFTTGVGIDASGGDTQPNPDTFAILEPLPTSDAPTSPGPGFLFDSNSASAVFVGNSGGQAPIDGIFTDGDNWFVSYSYTADLGGGGPNGPPIVPVPSPGVSVRRVKVSENFSPEVRNRCFFNYNFFNDAFGGLGDISRYTIGAERIVYENLISIEARLPMAATYASNQALGQPENRDFEIGNAFLIGKGVLLRSRDFVWSGGLGIGVPTADDTVLRSNNRTVLSVENETVHLFPFTGLLYRLNRDSIIQGAMQLDFALGGDTVRGDLTGDSLPTLGTFTDSTLMHLSVSASKVIHRNDCTRYPLREILANSELHYTGTLEDSDFVQGGGITYTNLARNFNILNTTLGLHVVFSNGLVVSPGMSVPLRDGLDEQFDYEALVQVNYLR